MDPFYLHAAVQSFKQAEKWRSNSDVMSLESYPAHKKFLSEYAVFTYIVTARGDVLLLDTPVCSSMETDLSSDLSEQTAKFMEEHFSFAAAELALQHALTFTTSSTGTNVCVPRKNDSRDVNFWQRTTNFLLGKTFEKLGRVPGDFLHRYQECYDSISEEARSLFFSTKSTVIKEKNDDTKEFMEYFYQTHAAIAQLLLDGNQEYEVLQQYCFYLNESENASGNAVLLGVQKKSASRTILDAVIMALEKCLECVSGSYFTSARIRSSLIQVLAFSYYDGTNLSTMTSLTPLL